MQWESNQVYKAAAEKNNADLEFYTALGNFVQKKLNEEIRAPRKLIIAVKGIGRWHLRKKPMLSSYENMKDLNPEDYITPNRPHTEDRIAKWHSELITLKERLDDYEPFLERKADAKRRKEEWENSKVSS